MHCWQSMEIRQKYNGQNCRYCFMLDCPVTEDFQPEAVVRCKGCKWRDGLCHYYTIHHNDNWFCADGERVEKR